MKFDIFDSFDGAQVWYHPLTDRLFIFHQASFLMPPCLEREDGMRCICTHPCDVNYKIQEKREKLMFIGEF